MKTNIKLLAIFFIVATIILYAIVYYVSGHAPNHGEDRMGVVFVMFFVVLVSGIYLSVEKKEKKQELLNAITCVKDKIIEEECKKDTDENN